MDCTPNRSTPWLCRRTLLQATAAFLAAPRLGKAAESFPADVTLMVAGPEGGLLDHWASVLTPLLAQSLPAPKGVHRLDIGAPDGVTGANRFDLRTVPDGSTALLLPGATPLTWLAGDPRAQFDIGHWVPMLAGMSPTLLVGRPELTGLPGNRKFRLGAASPAGLDLAALLSCDLLGLSISPVFGLTDAHALQQAYAEGTIDAVCIHGENALTQIAALPNAVPLATLDCADQDGVIRRDALFPATPTVQELLNTRNHPQDPLLHKAWIAACAATAIDALLVIPHLTPAAAVALWRRASADAIGTLELQAQAKVRGIRASLDPPSISTLAVDTATQLALHHWLVDRYNWRPA